MRRIALGLAYDGSRFRGWQVQRSPAVRTVQAELERALSEVAAQPLRLYCAGRTDAGVHASAQVLHFDAPCERPLKAWVNGGNSLLPDDVSIAWAQSVSDDFHARFSATARRYRYYLYTGPRRSALLHRRVTHWPHALEVEPMALAGQHLLGEHDFSAFRGAACQSRTPMRHVMHLDVLREGKLVIVDIKANAFLLHMVRNIVGVLLEIGAGRRKPAWAAELLAGRDRRQAAVTAPADGLYLVGVDYPAHFGLPAVDMGPLLLQP